MFFILNYYNLIISQFLYSFSFIIRNGNQTSSIIIKSKLMYGWSNNYAIMYLNTVLIKPN